MAGNDTQAIVKSFASELERMKPQIAAALPKHLSADRMARIALTEFRKNPKLADCTPKSVFASIIMASQLGLEPGVIGQAYLIPYKSECTFVPGWQGMVDLVSRTGRATTWTGAVFEGDDFEYQFGDRPFIHHRPGMEEDPKKLRYVYAVGRVNGSDWPVMDVWSMAKVWKHRDRFNKVGDRHYSYAHPEMYARKVVLLQVLKYMPKSVELTIASNLEHAAQEGRQGITIEAAVAKEYEGPANTDNEETEEERELRVSCEDLMQKQGFNPAQMEAKLSQNKGKLDQLLATLQKSGKPSGGGNAGGSVGSNTGNRSRGGVVQMEQKSVEEKHAPAQDDAEGAGEGAETSADRPQASEERSVKPGSRKQQTNLDWTV